MSRALPIAFPILVVSDAEAGAGEKLVHGRLFLLDHPTLLNPLFCLVNWDASHSVRVTNENIAVADMEAVDIDGRRASHYAKRSVSGNPAARPQAYSSPFDARNVSRVAIDDRCDGTERGEPVSHFITDNCSSTSRSIDIFQNDNGWRIGVCDQVV